MGVTLDGGSCTLTKMIFLPPPFASRPSKPWVNPSRIPKRALDASRFRKSSRVKRGKSDRTRTGPIELFKWMTHIPFALRAALSGAVAETVVNVVLFPLDTWKAHIQYGPSQCSQPGANRVSPLIASSPLGRITRAFTGVGPGMAASALDAFMFTLVYEALRQQFAQRRRRIQSARSKRPKNRKDWNEKAIDISRWKALEDFTAASLGALASTVVEAPFAVARDRMRLSLQPGLLSAWRAAMKMRGWRGLYAGSVASICRDVPVEATEFAAYGAMKRIYGRLSKQQITPVVACVCGAAAGAFTGILAAPVDLAVTRVMANPSAHKNVVATLVNVVRTNGLSGAFAGVRQKAGREALSSALFFVIYDGLKRFVGVDLDDDDDDGRKK